MTGRGLYVTAWQGNQGRDILAARDIVLTDDGPSKLSRGDVKRVLFHTPER